MNHYNKVSLALSFLLLTACHHDNPLKTQPSKASAVFLMNASANAEKRLHFTLQQDAFGYGYLECMEGKKSPEIHCQELFNGMMQFAKEGHYPAFKNMTLNDLTDSSVFKKIGDDYAEVAVTTWPHFYPTSQS